MTFMCVQKKFLNPGKKGRGNLPITYSIGIPCTTGQLNSKRIMGINMNNLYLEKYFSSSLGILLELSTALNLCRFAPQKVRSAEVEDLLFSNDLDRSLSFGLSDDASMCGNSRLGHLVASCLD